MSENGSKPLKNARLLYIRTKQHGGDWDIEPHTHACSELFYVVSGKGQIRIGEQTLPVTVDDLVLIQPQVQHTESSLDAQQLEYILLGVDGLEQILKEQMTDPFAILHYWSTSSDMQFYLREMLREKDSKAFGSEAVCQALLDVVVIRLLRYFDQRTQNMNECVTLSKESMMVRRYIENHFREPLTLDDLAQVVQLNKFHMVHTFTKEYGMSPIHLLITHRIRESCKLLTSTNLSLAEIAKATGFSSPSYFSQSFRRSEDMSPMEYRRRNREPKE